MAKLNRCKRCSSDKLICLQFHVAKPELENTDTIGCSKWDSVHVHVIQGSKRNANDICKRGAQGNSCVELHSLYLRSPPLSSFPLGFLPSDPPDGFSWFCPGSTKHSTFLVVRWMEKPAHVLNNASHVSHGGLQPMAHCQGEGNQALETTKFPHPP